MEFFLSKWPFQRGFCEKRGCGEGIWSSFCANGLFRDVFVKIAVAEEEFGVLSVQMAVSERFL